MITSNPALLFATVLLLSFSGATGSASAAPLSVDGDVAAFVGILEREVPVLLPASPDRDATIVDLARRMSSGSEAPPRDVELVLVVDRNPRAQTMSVVLARPEGRWDVLGTVNVSTGQAGRAGHFITPTGVFANDPGILGYRALGTYNENHIRGIGIKGMRVWDFGWRTASRGWRPGTSEIRLEMHATDPDVLERRLGKPASEGCVRIPSSMNRFLDVHGVIDRDIEAASVHDSRSAALLPGNRMPTPLAGRLLIVVDSSPAARS